MKKISIYLVAIIFAATLFSCGGGEKNEEEKENKDSKKTGSFTDSRDQHTYKTIKIGEQTWMAENLAYTVISSIYYKNEESNISIYGLLYDWETAKTVCPDGWHLPSDAEWYKLRKNIGEKYIAGSKLKSTSNLWKSPNKGADNSSGFNALPAGSHNANYGGFCFLGIITNFWTSTGYDAGNAGIFILDYDRESFMENIDLRSCMNSVRCIKD